MAISEGGSRQANEYADLQWHALKIAVSCAPQDVPAGTSHLRFGYSLTQAGRGLPVSLVYLTHSISVVSGCSGLFGMQSTGQTSTHCGVS